MATAAITPVTPVTPPTPLPSRSPSSTERMRRARRTVATLAITVVLLLAGAAVLGVQLTGTRAALDQEARQLAATRQDLHAKLKDISGLAAERRDLTAKVQALTDLNAQLQTTAADEFVCAKGLLAALSSAADDDWQGVSDHLANDAGGCDQAFGEYGDMAAQGSAVPAPAPAPAPAAPTTTT